MHTRQSRFFDMNHGTSVRGICPMGVDGYIAEKAERCENMGAKIMIRIAYHSEGAYGKA